MPGPNLPRAYSSEQESLPLKFQGSALIFDLDDTLLVDEEVSRETLKAVAESLGMSAQDRQEVFIKDVWMIANKRWQQGPLYSFCASIGISAIECLWGHFYGESSELCALRAWAKLYRREVFQEVLELTRIATTDAQEHALFFEQERRVRQRLFPKAFSLLKDFSKEYRLGLLTNGAPDLQREKLKASGLEYLFSAVIISGDHGIGKPNPIIFTIMLDQLNVSASQAIMIGNSLERDIAGASAAGIRSVWIDLGVQKEEQKNQQPPFDMRITELSELTTIL